MSDYEKLQMTAGKEEGAFVRGLEGRTGTGMESGTHIHKDWYAKTKGYDEIRELMERDVAEREDIVSELKHVVPLVDSEGRFCLDVKGRSFYPTPWALNQLAQRCKISTQYVRSLCENPTNNKGKETFQRDEQDALALRTAIRNGLRRLDSDKKFQLRTDKSGVLRAFLTTKYTAIDNRWYMDVLQNIIPQGRMSHWRGNSDTIYGNILLPDTIMDYGQQDDSDYGGMLSIGNCEIGKRRIAQYPSLFRSICMNGCIWGQVKGKDFSKVHKGNIDLNELRCTITENVEAQLSILPQGIEKMLSTRSMNVENVSMKNVIGAVAREYRLDKRSASQVAIEYATHEKHDQNLFGIVNAITRAGQTFNADEWVRFDNLGGQLLDMTENKWSNIVKRAESLDEKELKSIFMSVV